MLPPVSQTLSRLWRVCGSFLQCRTTSASTRTRTTRMWTPPWEPPSQSPTWPSLTPWDVGMREGSASLRWDWGKKGRWGLARFIRAKAGSWKLFIPVMVSRSLYLTGTVLRFLVRFWSQIILYVHDNNLLLLNFTQSINKIQHWF